MILFNSTLTNWKRGCNFLFVVTVTLVLSSPVSEILQVFFWEQRSPYSTQIFEMFLLNYSRRWGYTRNEDPKLINRVITLELTQLIWPRYINVKNGWTQDMVHRAVKVTWRRSPSSMIVSRPTIIDYDRKLSNHLMREAPGSKYRNVTSVFFVSISGHKPSTWAL